MIRWFKELFARWDNPWPDAVPLPEHVRNVRLDEKLLLHMSAARKPSAHVGYVKPSKE